MSDTEKTLQTNNNSGEFPDCRSFFGNVGVRDEGGEEELESPSSRPPCGDGEKES